MVTLEFLKLLKYWLCYKIDDNVLLINLVLPLAASAPVVLNCPFLNLLKRRVEKYNDRCIKSSSYFQLALTTLAQCGNRLTNTEMFLTRGPRSSFSSARPLELSAWGSGVGEGSSWWLSLMSSFKWIFRFSWLSKSELILSPIKKLKVTLNECQLSAVKLKNWKTLGIYFFGGRRGDILITYNRNNQVRNPPISWEKKYQFITNMCIGPVLLSLEILSLQDVD